MCLDPVRRNSLVVCVGGDSFIASSSLIDGCWCNELEIIQKKPAVCTSVNVASEMSNMSTELCREREKIWFSSHPFELFLLSTCQIQSTWAALPAAGLALMARRINDEVE